MTLVSWFVLLNQHDQCIQIHKQSSSNEKSFTEWIDQNQVMWQPHTHIYVYTWEFMFVKIHVQWHTHEKFLWPFWLFWPMYHFFQTQTQVGQSGKFPFSHQTQVEQRDQSSNNKRAIGLGTDGCAILELSQVDQTKRLNNEQPWEKRQRKVTFRKYVILVYTNVISLYSQRTAWRLLCER